MSVMKLLVASLAGAVSVAALPNALPSMIWHTEDAPKSTATEYNPIPEHIFPPGSIPTLRPVVPASHNGDHFDHLVPCEPGPGSPLHYAQENDDGEFNGGMFGIITPHFSHQSVVLDHANTATDVEMLNDNELLIGFDDPLAFAHARTHWEELENVVFTTFTPGCGDFEKHERCYFHATRLTFYPSKQAAVAFGWARSMKDVTSGYSLSFGSYHDRHAPGRVLKARQAPTATITAPGVTAPTNGPAQYVFDPDAHDCTGPVDSKYGLPTACLGPYFDDDLDDDLDYKDATQFPWSDYYASVFTGATGVEDQLDVAKRFIDIKKIPVIGKPIAKVATKVVEVKDKTVKAVNSAANGVKDAVVGGVNTVVAIGEGIGKIILGKPFNVERNWNSLRIPTPKDSDDCKKKSDSCKPKGDAKSVESPWGGDAILVKSFGTAPDEKEIVKGKKTRTKLSGSFLNIYCVDCGFNGALKLKGTLTVENIKGITQGSIEADLTSKVGLGLGVYAQWIKGDKFDREFFTVPLSPFTIGAATIGPYATIGGRFEIQANITGHMLARVDVNLGTAKFKYDLVKRTSDKTGLQPQFVPSFEAEGTVTLTATLGIPIGLKIGIDLLSGCGKCKGDIGVETYPHVAAEAIFAVEAKANKTFKTAGIKPVNDCLGVHAGISLGNKITAKFNGFGLIEKEWPIHEAKDLFPHSVCLGKKVEKRQDDTPIWAPTNTLEAPSSSNDTVGSLDVVEVTDLVVADSEYASFDPTNIPISSYPLDNDGLEGYWYTTINYGGKTDDKVLFVACNDNNVYIMEASTLKNLPSYQSCQFLWGGYQGVILDAPGDSILYHYNNTMAVAGVSRLRVADENEVPDGAVLTVLVPYDGGSTDLSKDYFVASDINGNVFYPVVCTYKDSHEARIFVVSDLIKGIATLKSGDVKYSVAGGDINDCIFLHINWGASSDHEWASTDTTVTSAYLNNPIEFEFDETNFNDDGDFYTNVTTISVEPALDLPADFFDV